MLGRETYGGCVVGEDGQGLLRSLHPGSQVLARRAACSNPDDRLEHTPLHSATCSHSTTEGHLGVYLLF
jgi:hypothetical protein